MALVNLLPWRADRRRARGRVWLLSLAAGGLWLCLLAGYGYQRLNWQNQHIARHIAQQQTRNQALQQRITRDKTRLAQQQAAQAARARQQDIRQWRTLLEHIARQLPPGAWLSRLHYQQPQLQIEGQAHSLADLQGSIQLFSQLPGFASPQTGDTEHQADHWRFHVTLTRHTP